ncbi:mechanosensitive ion channel [Qipengyuania sp. YG27]|uniref:Small-conductance mechanosensitive channel n=2 Tax=Qipengyuania mesophila TaxID=2867246 RepID=A0ABS7JTR8_9SPHN|nr:mechanosensitive ion channel family protein [Qipengyuania mesophila]MBX7501045.1 mechanosensitive ion channel [Qipengyuania mesophila]
MRLLLLLAWGLAISVPAHAQLPELDQPTEAASPEAPAPAQTIATTQDSGADAKIAERIAGIFAELPAFSSVSVAVAQGVVTLSGTVPQQADIARAEAIAGRVSGVVTVENRLERDLSISSESGGIATLADRWEGLVKLLPLIALALAVWAGITLVGYLIAGLERLWHRLAPNSFLAELIASAIRFIFAIVGLVVALDMVGASALLGAVLGGAGVVGIALGFAMRDTIENYVASLMLSLRQPFRANDWVVIDDKEGRVIRLTSRATILMTLEGNHLRIPNGQVFRAVILNYTRNPQRRFDFDLGVDADDDADAARQLGRETLAGLPFVLGDPAPEARVIEVGESNVVLRFLGWIDQREADWYKARSGAILAVKAALEDGGFALPEPIYRLRFDARTQPLPLATTRERAASPADTAPPKKPAPAAAVADVTPQEEISEMVEAERRQAKGASEKDLLDTSRPVE